jgi:hypothetical protein
VLVLAGSVAGGALGVKPKLYAVESRLVDELRMPSLGGTAHEDNCPDVVGVVQHGVYPAARQRLGWVFAGWPAAEPEFLKRVTQWVMLYSPVS